ncbi:MAG: DUF2116 family Zn-ribbon domain-containing protein [Promethearchaeota archaeon]
MSQSSWKDQIKKQWGPHKHCPVCGKAMAPSKTFCSQACKDNYLKKERKQKRMGRIQLIFLFGMMIVMFFLLFVFS